MGGQEGGGRPGRQWSEARRERAGMVEGERSKGKNMFLKSKKKKKKIDPASEYRLLHKTNICKKVISCKFCWTPGHANVK